MRTIIFVAALLVLPVSTFAASTDYYLKIDGVKGETSTQKSSDAAELEARTATGTQKASVDAYIKIDGIDGETKAAGIEPDEIDVAIDDEPLTPDFGILLGGGSDEGEGDESRAEIAAILLEGLAEEGAPAEQLSLNYEKIKTSVRHELRLFGFIPIATTAVVEIDAAKEVSVSLPWWSFLASGADKDAIGLKVVTSISNVLKTKHDTVMNSIRNIK